MPLKKVACPNFDQNKLNEHSDRRVKTRKNYRQHLKKNKTTNIITTLSTCTEMQKLYFFIACLFNLVEARKEALNPNFLKERSMETCEKVIFTVTCPHFSTGSITPTSNSPVTVQHFTGPVSCCQHNRG